MVKIKRISKKESNAIAGALILLNELVYVLARKDYADKKDKLFDVVGGIFPFDAKNNKNWGN